MEERIREYRDLFDNFMNSLTPDMTKYANRVSRFVLPIIPKEIIINLCQDVSEIFANENILLELNSPCVIVGDIHGHILDLYRIIAAFHIPNPTHYLFLGDIVDRGEFSLESCALVFLMKVLFPDHVHIIRGNHEFSFLCTQGGFSQQLTDVYNDTPLLPNFIHAFSLMPLSAIIDDKIFCVHGGLGPSIFSVQQLKEIKRPIFDFGDPTIDSMLWSDPNTKVDFFGHSDRGTGCYFGSAAVADFLRSNNLSLLVRAHECVVQGIEYMFDNKLVTVFTASNYCGIVENQSGVLVVDSNGVSEKRFPPLPYLKRALAIFKKPLKSTRKLMKPSGLLQHNAMSAVVRRQNKAEISSMANPHTNAVNSLKRINQSYSATTSTALTGFNGYNALEIINQIEASLNTANLNANDTINSPNSNKTTMNTANNNNNPSTGNPRVLQPFQGKPQIIVRPNVAFQQRRFSMF
ncbi:Ser/Thr protein phosphatase [Tritrichomonas foetus]|uniref:Serine/threonine-protein phosphatase n=1 Tax=Tritrichomonas foetus TaxID=1144522 RepID=A0A1J4JI19_9EUKA|nr:Ser/Thr protein phosphatase [Tritrichomonas foetus]|eukprot:OHS97911.1 Ser/Thr protein phosphatase [Tritrichomonas foetus]